MNAPKHLSDEFSTARPMVESERKFSVPPHLADDLWHLLTCWFDTAHFGDQLEACPNDVHYLDTYYDNPNLALLKQGCGLRHRVRLSGDPAEIVQLKSEEPGEFDRLEQSFPVWSERFVQNTTHLADKILHEHRPAFCAQLKTLSVEPTSLQPTLSLGQRRQRLHVARNGQPLLTLSLDRVESRFWWETFEATELEIELDTPEADALAIQIAAACQQHYPELYADQTPKYRKAFEFFRTRFLRFPLALRTRTPVELMAGSVLVLGALGLAALFSLSRKR